jgi:hypothetical protein
MDFFESSYDVLKCAMISNSDLGPELINNSNTGDLLSGIKRKG